MTAELCDLDAVALRQMIAKRDISPVELLDSCFGRIEAVNPALNAVIATSYNEALLQARAAEETAGSADNHSPLHGLPILVKDLTDTKGLRTTYGSLCFAEHVPTADATPVSRLRKAGAIIVGKTNTPEFGAGANTKNKLHGATVNPFDTALTCGGSSGGSAVAMACGMAPLATGSDFGGSLRVPASFCSVVGIRPSSGLVPSSSRTLGFSPFWTDGPMARSVADAALCLEALAGYEALDPLSYPASAGFSADTGRPVDLSDTRIGLSADLGFAPIDDGILKTFQDRKSRLAPYFAKLWDVPLDLSEAKEAFRILRAGELVATFGELVKEHGDTIGQNVRANVNDAQKYTLSDAAFAAAAQTRLFQRFQELFQDIDILICPATAVSPFPVAEDHPLQINGRPLDSYFDWYAITWALSLVGCPVVSIPCGRDHNKMPFGIQVAGPRHMDAHVIQVARALEDALLRDGNGRMKPDLTRLR